MQRKWLPRNLIPPKYSLYGTTLVTLVETLACSQALATSCIQASFPLFITCKLATPISHWLSGRNVFIHCMQATPISHWRTCLGIMTILWCSFGTPSLKLTTTTAHVHIPLWQSTFSIWADHMLNEESCSTSHDCLLEARQLAKCTNIPGCIWDGGFPPLTVTTKPKHCTPHSPQSKGPWLTQDLAKDEVLITKVPPCTCTCINTCMYEPWNKGHAMNN